MTEPARELGLEVVLEAYLRARELEEARELDSVAPTDSELRSHLEEAYWREARQACDAAVTDPPGESLEFPNSACWLLDYGVIGHEVLDPVIERLERAEDTVVLAHRALQQAYRAALRMGITDRLSNRLELVEHDIRDWPQTQLLHVRFRDRCALDLFGGSARGRELLRLFGEMDERMESYVRLKQHVEAVRSPDARVVGEWREVRTWMHERREAMRGLMLPYAETAPERAEALEAAAEAVVESVGNLLSLQAARREIERELIEEEGSRRAATAAEVRAALHGELGRFRALMRLAARYAGEPEQSMPLGDVTELLTPGEIAHAFEHVRAFDPGFVRFAPGSRWSEPGLLLLPGCGLGVYDTAGNRLVLPLSAPHGAIATVAHAVVVMRLLMDEENGGALLESYRETVHGRGTELSRLKLRNAFVEDYLRWMAEESFGRDALTRSAREWFEAHIAPPKDAPWLTPEIASLPDARVAAELKRTEQEPPSPARDFKLALLHWRADHASAEAERLASSALKAEPDNLRYIYSCAVLYMHAGRHREAMDLFSRFSSLAPAGWRARKAAELLARCRP